MKAYQLIETDFTGKIVNLKEVPNLDVCTILWLIDTLKCDIEIKKLPIEIDFVCASYDSKNYPCIGIHYIKETAQDFSSNLEEKIEEILKYPFLSFYNFIENNFELIQKSIVKVSEAPAKR